MDKQKLIILDAVAWTLGFIAIGLLIWGIIRVLIN